MPRLGSRGTEDGDDVPQGLRGLGDEVVRLELAGFRVPADLSADEDEATCRSDAVRIAGGTGPACGLEDL